MKITHTVTLFATRTNTLQLDNQLVQDLISIGYTPEYAKDAVMFAQFAGCCHLCRGNEELMQQIKNKLISLGYKAEVELYQSRKKDPLKLYMQGEITKSELDKRCPPYSNYAAYLDAKAKRQAGH